MKYIEVGSIIVIEGSGYYKIKEIKDEVILTIERKYNRLDNYKEIMVINLYTTNIKIMSDQQKKYEIDRIWENFEWLSDLEYVKKIESNFGYEYINKIHKINIDGKKIYVTPIFEYTDNFSIFNIYEKQESREFDKYNILGSKINKDEVDKILIQYEKHKLKNASEEEKQKYKGLLSIFNHNDKQGAISII